MRQALSEGHYEEAFVSAKALRSEKCSMDLKREAEQCCVVCADNGVLDAMILETERMLNRSDGRPVADAFPYLQKLADAGYIRSFLWIAECYYEGIGCERDLKKAKSYFLEAVLFGDNQMAKRMLARMQPESAERREHPMNRILRNLLSEDQNKVDFARIRVAELILDGKLQGYASNSAYVLLKLTYPRFWDCDDGIAQYRLGECVLNGIGTPRNPYVADELFRMAEADLECTLDYLDDEFTQEIMRETLHTEDGYRKVFEKIGSLIAQTAEEMRQIEMQDAVQMCGGYQEFDMYFDEWEKEVPEYIKRV